MKKMPFFIDLLATGLYLGKIPFAPGTFGSLLALPFGYAAFLLPVYAKWLLLALVFGVGVYVSDRFATLSGVADPSCVVIDEVAGLLLFYIIFPFDWRYIISGFILFRIFDIWKPFPVSTAEMLPGGLGIMADDIVAGLYAVLVCFIFKIITGWV